MSLVVTITFDDERAEKILREVGSINNDDVRKFVIDCIDRATNNNKGGKKNG